MYGFDAARVPKQQELSRSIQLSAAGLLDHLEQNKLIDWISCLKLATTNMCYSRRAANPGYPQLCRNVFLLQHSIYILHYSPEPGLNPIWSYPATSQKFCSRLSGGANLTLG